MIEKNKYEEFFDGHAPIYMENCFTKNTIAEIDFVLNELKLPLGSLILDIGCGVGRHSIELAKRGYKVTGIDISYGMLAEAKKNAKEINVDVEWIHTNAMQFIPNKSYDAAICLCEGAFCLLGKGDDPIKRDLKILLNIHTALKAGAGFILTALNGFANIRKFNQKDTETGRFDILTMTELYTLSIDTPEGKKDILLRERSYIPTELTMLFHQAGFEIKHIGGGTAGNWGYRPIELDEIEIMVIARKPIN